MQWWPHRIKKSDHHSMRERGGDEEEQKNEKKSAQETKSKKANVFRIRSNLASTPRPSQKNLRAALWTTDASLFGLFIGSVSSFQIIGSCSKIKLVKLTKRVLQRVLRYYPRSTLPGCAPKDPHPIYLLPNICSVGAPVCKVVPCGLQRCTKVKGASKNCPRKAKSLHH
jgi:hypothetical protein